MIQIPSPRSSKKARIEIVPLIDIIFFLLATFVMVSLSMVKNQAIPVHLPEASTGTSQERKDFSSISITAAGGIYLDKQPVDAAQLEAGLRQILAANPEPRIFIAGDKQAEFGAAIAVLDQVRKLGITKIAIETNPEAAKR